MKSSPKTGLAKVQHLYVMQVELMKVFSEDLKDPTKRKEAKKCLSEFSKLLQQADWQYMGGEDVLEGLKLIQREFSSKLNRSTKRKATAKSTKKSVAKKTVKKSAKKKPRRKL